MMPSYHSIKYIQIIKLKKIKISNKFKYYKKELGKHPKYVTFKKIIGINYFKYNFRNFLAKIILKFFQRIQ